MYFHILSELWSHLLGNGIQPVKTHASHPQKFSLPKKQKKRKQRKEQLLQDQLKTAVKMEVEIIITTSVSVMKSSIITVLEGPEQCHFRTIIQVILW